MTFIYVLHSLSLTSQEPVLLSLPARHMLLGLARVARPGRRPSLPTPWRRTLPLLAAALAMAAAPPQADGLTPRSRARGALFGALVGDALSLGGQYEYDAKVIASKVGRRVQRVAARRCARVSQLAGCKRCQPQELASTSLDSLDSLCITTVTLSSTLPRSTTAWGGGARTTIQGR